MIADLVSQNTWRWHMKSFILKLHRHGSILTIATLLAIAVYAATTSAAIADPLEILTPATITNWVGDPLLTWKCTELHTEASVQLVELATGLTIQTTPWQKIIKHSADGKVCTTREGSYLEKLIKPPITIPCIPSSPHQAKMCPPTYSGLVSGKYEAILNLRGDGLPSMTQIFPFQVIDNIKTDFSAGHDHWNSLRGNWATSGGQYVAHGLGTGKRAVAHYDGNVFVDKPTGGSFPSNLMGTRDYEAIITLNCSNTSCAGGVAVGLFCTGGAPASLNYAWFEFVVSGNRKLSITGVWEAPQQNIPIASGIDLSKLIEVGKPFRLKVTYSNNPALSQVAVDGHIVSCVDYKGFNTPGDAGLVFSSPNSADSMSVDSVEVGTSRNDTYYQWCQFPIPSN
jgi:hypothetical protein